MLKIRRPLGRLIFNMGIAIPGKTVFLIETAPCWPGAFTPAHQWLRCWLRTHAFPAVYGLNHSVRVTHLCLSKINDRYSISPLVCKMVVNLSRPQCVNTRNSNHIRSTAPISNTAELFLKRSNFYEVEDCSPSTWIEPTIYQLPIDCFNL